MANILIIDGYEDFAKGFSHQISQLGHRSISASTLLRGLTHVQDSEIDLVVLQSILPDGSSLEVLPRIMASPSKPEVIVIGDEVNSQEAELAIRKGAWGYFKRSDNVEPLIKTMSRALEYRQGNGHKAKTVSQTRREDIKFEGIIGESPPMKLCAELVAQAAGSNAPVLITGETGTGKELFAQAIHDNSPRAGRNFVVLDCASLPETLVESTLFGHTKGAYTGALASQEGLLKQADGGTLFLDEVGEMPLHVQASFLRVLQTYRYRPVGSGKEIKSDFRIVAATNQDLDEAVKQQRFRKDLLFRLQTFSIKLPPLRERMEDIPKLVGYHLADLYTTYNMAPCELAADFLESLHDYDWPGNVREMFNAVERALICARGESTVFAKHLPPEIRIKVAQSGAVEAERAVVSGVKSRESAPLPTLQGVRDEALAQVEKNYLQELVTSRKWDLEVCCRVADVSRSRLYALLKRHRISKY